jgi:hypothetical protein
LHRCAAGQVGNGAGHAQRAVGAAGAPAQAVGGGVQKSKLPENIRKFGMCSFDEK